RRDLRGRRRVVLGALSHALLPDEFADAVRVVLPARRLRRTARLRVLRSSPQPCPHVGRLAVEMLKKEISANCGHVFFRPLDRLGADVSVLLAPSTERK